MPKWDLVKFFLYHIVVSWPGHSLNPKRLKIIMLEYYTDIRIPNLVLTKKDIYDHDTQITGFSHFILKSLHIIYSASHSGEGENEI